MHVYQLFIIMYAYKLVTVYNARGEKTFNWIW